MYRGESKILNCLANGELATPAKGKMFTQGKAVNGTIRLHLVRKWHVEPLEIKEDLARIKKSMKTKNRFMQIKISAVPLNNMIHTVKEHKFINQKTRVRSSSRW